MIKLLVTPLLLVFLCLLSGCAVLTYGIKRENRRLLKRGITLVFAGTAILYLLSLSPVASGLAWWLESGYPPPGNDKISSLQTIVVLGGGVLKEGEGRPHPSLSSSSYARVLHGVEMFRKSHAETLVMAGGTDKENTPVVSELMKEMAVTLGVSEKTIFVERRSENTDQHPRELLRLTGAIGRTARIGLVTSAWHMPRAMASFSRYFDHVIPLPCDPMSGAIQWSAMLLLPSVDALSYSTTAIHEFAGLMWYKSMWSVSSNDYLQREQNVYLS